MLVTPNISAAASAAKKPKPTAMQTYVDAMQPGWNLGNTLDATGADETSWGNPKVTKELIKKIADQGYRSIRIPVTWDVHIGAAPSYTIEAAYLARVRQVVDWALAEKLYVMINVHHDSWMWVSGMEQKHDEVLARYNAVWKQVAATFKNYPNKLMFESINEPRFTDGGTTDEAKATAMLNELNKSFHSIVRSSGGKNSARPLVLPSLESSPTQERMDVLYQTITGLKDPNLIATVHYYGFWPFSVNIAGYTKFDADTQNDIIQTFDKVHATFTAKGIPVILGEYGLLGFDQSTAAIEQGEKLKFFEFLGYYLKEKRITSMLWDNGQHFGRTTYKWSDPQLFTMIKTSWTTRSATAESDLIYLEKDAAVKDTTVLLNLNGNKLKLLSVAGSKLKQGSDYTLSGNKLTIKAAKLKSLTKSGKLGVNATLTAKFNKGAAWTFKLTVYAKPKLSNAIGTTTSFKIPAAFNGDSLATMEAVYAAGGNAGPQNWTPYKEFAYTFSPSYSTGEISLTENFFKEVNDGEVILKFHFWSGQIISYKLTKSGTAVSGEAI
ncbi:cellulase family glycosylhydrolase [Paenibacillus sp. FSL R7-0331]|uniref:cellulase family glycosylhydrolase n=1 Tax=Paenibacillus sp. FSL R7-0331 TaxID=1536773 RepID=UPI0005A7A601|nr:cellulase family glycosylhydrolase [Paenibacillus sp. FSL R7-0331]